MSNQTCTYCILRQENPQLLEKMKFTSQNLKDEIINISNYLILNLVVSLWQGFCLV